MPRPAADLLRPDRRRRALRWALTLALGTVGGLAARALGLPLPWLIGALMAVGAASASGLRLAGGPPDFPQTLREYCIPVIGVLIGGTFTPETLSGALAWWPGLIAAIAFVPTALLANYVLFSRFGGLSRPTAFFAGMPGGLVEAIELGAENGADARPLTVLQFTRVVLVVTALPLLFSLVEGRALGSAAGVSVAREGAGLGLVDVLVLTASGALGYRFATRWGLPAGRIIGPIFASGAVHAAGLTDAAPPAFLVAAAQLVIGTGLGLRFVGLERRELARYLRLSAASVALMLAIAAAFSSVAAAAGAAPFGIMMLALAPGGVVEMGLVALSLNANPIFVTLHHLVRILAAVGAGVGLWRLVGRGG